VPDRPQPFDDLPILAELGESLDAAFARELARVPRRARFAWPARRTVRSVALAVVLLVALAATAAAATVWVLRGSPIPTPAERDVQPTMRPLPHSQHLLALRAADPEGGPSWGIRVGRSQTGLVCSTVGQVVAGQLGVVGFDKRFRPLPDGVLDSCGQEREDAPALIGARVFDAPVRADVRTVVNGVAGRTVRSVALLTTTGRRPLPIGERGAFVTAVRGYPEDLALRVELRFADGHVQVQNLGADRFIHPDPRRGPAWKVWAWMTSSYDGTCVSFAPARPGTNPPTAPAACGHSLGPRNGGQRDPWFFAIRRLAPGDHGRTGMMPWDWHRSPARTAVWGSVRRDRVRSLIVRGPDGARNVRPTINGSFLAIYGPKVQPGQLSVELVLTDGRHLTFHRSTGLITPTRWHR
jgi:hypothetical protein